MTPETKRALQWGALVGIVLDVVLFLDYVRPQPTIWPKRPVMPDQ